MSDMVRLNNCGTLMVSVPLIHVTAPRWVKGRHPVRVVRNNLWFIDMVVVRPVTQK